MPDCFVRSGILELMVMVVNLVFDNHPFTYAGKMAFDTHPLGNFASKLLENRQHAASATPNNKIF